MFIMLINHFACYCLKKLPIILFLKRRVMLRTQLNITVAIRLLTTFCCIPCNSLEMTVLVYSVGEREECLGDANVSTCKSNWYHVLHVRTVGPWVWLYYENEMRGVFGDTPALDVVKMYDAKLFW